MSATANVITKNRRLAILRFLAEDADYSHNTSVLQSALAQIGHGVSRDVVEADAAWLDEQELATIDRVEGLPVTVLHITGRGLDVARGFAVHPGVDRPLPR